MDDLQWRVMSIAYMEDQQGALKVPLDRFEKLPGADVPEGTHNALLRTLHDLQEAGFVELVDMKLLHRTKGIIHWMTLNEGSEGVRITSAGAEWVERFADEGESIAPIGFQTDD